MASSLAFVELMLVGLPPVVAWTPVPLHRLAARLTLVRGFALNMKDSEDLDLLGKMDERWKYLQGRNWRSGVTDLDRLKAAEMAEAMQARKDKKLAESDTRRWCVDRCLSTGHCEAVEDILRMTTKQVMAFCQECADEEGCDLDFRKANEYMEDLSEAAWTAENAAG